MLDTRLAARPSTAYSFTPRRAARRESMPPHFASKRLLATSEPHTTAVIFATMISASATACCGAGARPGTNSPSTTAQNSAMPSQRTALPRKASTRRQPRGAKRSARQSTAHSRATGHRFCSNTPGARPKTAPPSNKPAGSATTPHKTPCIKPITSWLCSAPSEAGSTKLTRQPRVEATSSPAYAASCGVAASACAMAQPPISGASTRPAGSAASNGSALPPCPAMPDRAETATLYIPAMERHSGPMAASPLRKAGATPSLPPRASSAAPSAANSKRTATGAFTFSPARRPLPARRFLPA